ncbi:hypothetical protein F441_09788, partial [Phytophthora nicotianae CJ01A1]
KPDVVDRRRRPQGYEDVAPAIHAYIDKCSKTVILLPAALAAEEVAQQTQIIISV